MVGWNSGEANASSNGADAFGEYTELYIFFCWGNVGGRSDNSTSLALRMGFSLACLDGLGGFLGEYFRSE